LCFAYRLLRLQAEDQFLGAFLQGCSRRIVSAGLDWLCLRFISSCPIRNEMPLQPGDVTLTYADMDHTFEKLGFKPSITLEEVCSHAMGCATYCFEVCFRPPGRENGK
jgi:hypothetical protein